MIIKEQNIRIDHGGIFGKFESLDKIKGNIEEV